MQDHYTTITARAEGLLQTQHRMREVFRQRAYEEVTTPVLVDYEILRQGNGTPAETMYKLIGEEGEVLALKGDMTTPIAQLAASEWAAVPRPLRLSYVSQVFRRGGDGFGARELLQAGVELIGLAGPEADGEVIATACEALKRCGLDQFQVSVGHNGLLREILDSLAMEESRRSALRDALVRRDFVEARQILGGQEGGSPGLVEAFSPFGSRRSLDVLSGMGLDLPGLQRLREVVAMLDVCGVSRHLYVDVSMARGFDYYTGVVFEIYCPRSGQVLGGGGRYDRLTGAFGAPEVATGFALDLDRVLSSLSEESRPGRERKWLVFGGTSMAREVLSAVRELRQSGCRAAVHWTDSLEEGAAEELAASMGFSGVVLLSPDGERVFRHVSGERVRES